MARYRRKRHLYEVMHETWPKSTYGKQLERLHPEETTEDKSSAEQPTAPVSKKLSKWPTRPRIVQFNAGRIEFSIPYQLAIAILLGIVLLLLVFYRLGQSAAPKSPKKASSVVESSQSQASAAGLIQTELEQVSPPAEEAPANVENIGPVRPQGDNRIVIQTYQLRAPLEPVKQYFAGFGIETEIRKIDRWYYLVTTDKYENPEKPGTNGYIAKQRIIELGADYRAPKGYESFGQKPFHDAYGMNFGD